MWCGLGRLVSRRRGGFFALMVRSVFCMTMKGVPL